MAKASAPGKILWLGAYSVLFPQNTAFVTAVDARSHAEATKRADNRIEFSSKSLGMEAAGKLASGRVVWDAGVDGKKLSFAAAAVEFCAKFLEHKKKGFSGTGLTTWNDEAFGDGNKKTGLGSSAASTVAMVAAMLAQHGFATEENLDYVHKLSQLAHARAQEGVGSGFDVAAACYGTIAYSRFPPEVAKEAEKDFVAAIESPWSYRMQRMRLPEGFEIAAAFTGRPAPTVSLAKAALSYDEKDHQGFSLLMEQLNAQNEKAALFLQNIRDLQQRHPENYEKIVGHLQGKVGRAEVLALEEELTYFNEFRHAFAAGRRLTKKLGELSGAPIESDEMTALIGESERHGAFCCKLPGAGGGDSIAALCLGVGEKERLEDFWESRGLEILRLSEAREGVRAER